MSEHPVLSQPLAGVRVVDLTQVVAGPVASLMLADFGADVIKVEPLLGEAYRRRGRDENGNETANLNIVRWTRGKRSVALDLKSPQGRAVLERLLQTADVLLENFRPGKLAALGFSRQEIERINPTLIYASVTGFGQPSVSSGSSEPPVYAIIAEAFAGIMNLNLTGQANARRPAWGGYPMADVFAGMLAFAGVLLALRQRDAGRLPSDVDVSMFDGAVFMNELSVVMHSAGHELMTEGHSLQSPWGVYEAKDGYVVIAVMTDQQWLSACRAAGLDELANDPRLRSGPSRATYDSEVVRPAFERWTRSHSRSDIAAQFTTAQVPVAPVNTVDDVVESPVLQARNMFVRTHDRDHGEVTSIGNPIKGSRFSTPTKADIPVLGAHTREILLGIGYSETEIRDLVDDGVVLAPESPESPGAA